MSLEVYGSLQAEPGSRVPRRPRLLGVLVRLALMCLALFGARLACAAVDDSKASRWAAEALEAGSGSGAESARKTIDAIRSPSDVQRAWRALKQCRDAGNSLDMNLAAAEHYLFARFVASSDGDTSYRRLPAWYDAVKSAAFKASIQQWLQTSDQPATAPDPGLVKWGNSGIERGLVEFKVRTGKNPKNSGRALLVVFGTTYFHYYYKDSGYDKLPGPCTVRTPK